MNGKSAAALTFVPLDGTVPVPLAAPGKPTVVVAFASWCVACMQEMPRTVADAKTYGGRVAFVGIDYGESPSVARSLVAKFAIPFPVEAFQGGSAQALAGAAASQGETLELPLPKTPAELEAIVKALPAEFATKVRDVYAARATMSPSEFAAYETKTGVFFKTPEEIAADAAKTAAEAPATLDLPHTFLIDKNGKVVTILEGYNTTTDDLVAAMRKLGWIAP